jgi:dihydrolipoamide dehydrogenase
MQDIFDVIVVGGGPGGYAAAVRAGQLGLRVACVEQGVPENTARLGGTCLNVGCIPSKIFLDAAQRYHNARAGLWGPGITGTSKFQLDFKALMAHKNAVTQGLSDGIAGLFRTHCVTHVKGRADFQHSDLKNHTIRVKTADQTMQLQATRGIVLAMGSRPVAFPGIPFDTHAGIISSDDLFALDSVPRSVCIVGGGYIGLECGQFLQHLGADVHVFEAAPRLAPWADADIANALHQGLKKHGLTIHTSALVQEIHARRGKRGCRITYGEQTFQADMVLVALGRTPHVDGLAESGIQVSQSGHISVNEGFETHVSGVYAIGDLIDGPMLAHKAEAEGVRVASHLAREAIAPLNYAHIPAVVYTTPQVASVGWHEAQLRTAKIPYVQGKAPWRACGRAHISGGTEGFIKILAHAHTRRVLGIHMVGAESETLIGLGVLALESGVTSDTLSHMCHAHPTRSELFRDAASACKSGKNRQQ